MSPTPFGGWASTTFIRTNSQGLGFLHSFSLTQYNDSLINQIRQVNPRMLLELYGYMSLDSLLNTNRLEQAEIYMWEVGKGLITLEKPIFNLALMKDTTNADDIGYVTVTESDPTSSLIQSYAYSYYFHTDAKRFQDKEFTWDVEGNIIRTITFCNLEDDPFHQFHKIEPTAYPFTYEQYYISVFTLGESNYSVFVKLLSTIEKEEQLIEMEEQLLEIGTKNTIQLHDVRK